MPELEPLLKAGYLSVLDVHFARAMLRLAGERSQPVLLAAALTSRFTGQGHVCLDVRRLAGRRIETEEGERLDGLRWPPAEEWLAALAGSRLFSTGEQPAPLVMDEHGRLYLMRYWRYQRRLAEALKRRALVPADKVDAPLLEEGLARLFPTDVQGDPGDRQRLAAEMSVRRRLAVVSGGPGTGKTYTVARILALLIEQALAAGDTAPRMVLAAPTGKAAARLKEALTRAKTAGSAGGLRCPREVLTLLPEEAATLHRVLQPRGDDPTRFRHGAERPLPAEVVVIDESSMVDLALMTKMVEAVAQQARLILLGDKDQLASVEAGAIFGDICRAGLESAPIGSEAGGPPGPQENRRRHRNGFRGCVVHLSHSYRFGARSGIGALAGAVNAGDADRALAVLGDPRFGDATLLSPAEPHAVAARIEPFVRRYFQPLLDEHDTAGMLRRLGRFRILCAHRRGTEGSAWINQLTTVLLKRRTGVDTASEWYPGRPVMVLRNDYQLRLFNGDVGIIAGGDGGTDRLRAVFSNGEGRPRELPPSRLPLHETVYAMTVHKSQGSEFDHLLVVLPSHPSPVVTRELLYTAVTRARERVTILATEAMLRHALATPIQRASGLTEALRS
jgi:exodeoxyribonuclease V alpha subunit